MGDSQDSERATIPGVSQVYRVAHSYLGSLWIALDARDGEPGKPVLLRHVELPDRTPVEALQRIACAARDAMALNHENVLPVVGVFSREQSLAIAYAYVQAEPLRSLQSWASLRGAHFPIDVSLRISLDLLRGVKALHGALHGWPSAPPFGGLSPDSVLLSRDGRTRLCDPLVSSCAALLEGFGFNDAKLAYAAPEQVHATAPLGTASDVFTCAAMLWELLTGRRLLSGSRAVIERKLLEHALPKLRDNLRDGSGVSGALMDVIERSLSADASRRPQTPAALATQLEQCGHEVATPGQVARFVNDICGTHFERRGAAIRTKFSPELQAELESSFEVSPAVSVRKGRTGRSMPPRSALEASPLEGLASLSPAAPSIPAPVATVAAAPRGATARRIPLPARATAASPIAARIPLFGGGPRARQEPLAAPSPPPASPPAPPPIAAEPAPSEPDRSAPEQREADTAIPQLEPEIRVVPEDASASVPPESDPDGWGAHESSPPVAAQPDAEDQPTARELPSVEQPLMGSALRSQPPSADDWEWPEPERPPSAALPRVVAAVPPPPSPVRVAPRPGPKRTGAPLGGGTMVGLGVLELGPSPDPSTPAAESPPEPPASPVPPLAASTPEPASIPSERLPLEIDSNDLDMLQEETDPTQSVTADGAFPQIEEVVPRMPSWTPPRNLNAWSHAPAPSSKPRRRAVLIGTLATLALGIAIAVALLLRSVPNDSARGAAPPVAARDPGPAVPPASEPAPAAAPALDTGATSAPTPAAVDAGDEARPAPDAAAEAPNAALEAAPLEFAGAELSDAQLVRLFALESRSELPSCAKRLGASVRRHGGKDPAKSQAQLKAARKQLLRGDSEKALLALCSATAHYAANTAAWQLLAELSLQLGDGARAKQAVEQALKRKPADPTLLGIQGDAFALLGNLARSRELWAKSAKVTGSGAERTRRLATLFGAIGDRQLKSRSHGAALAYYRRAAVLSAGGHGPSAGMSEALRLLGQTPPSLAWSERVARAFPRQPRTRVAAGKP